MKLPFIKMHGAGNDYIYIDGFHYYLPHAETLAIALSDRHFGIGADGLIVIRPSTIADCRMQMFNADGSEGRMCGNAIRCVGKWMYEQSGLHLSTMSIETLSGIKTLHLTIKNRSVESVSVEMGRAQFNCTEIPVAADTTEFIDQPLTIQGTTYHVTAVSMGNPHAVIFTQAIDQIDLPSLGPLFEHHTMFPDRINTEFVEVVDSTHLHMRVWERGSGETLACGTGACAAVAAAIKNKLMPYNTPIEVTLRGGKLTIQVNHSYEVEMSGTATYVFSGQIEVPDIITINNDSL